MATSWRNAGLDAGPYGRPAAASSSPPQAGGDPTSMSMEHAGTTEAHGKEERTEPRKDADSDQLRWGASRRFRPCHPKGRSEAEHPGGRSPEGLTGAEGARRWEMLRTE